MFTIGNSLRIGTFIPVNFHNDPLASFSLTNFDFLQLHTAHFNKSIVLPFLVFITFIFLTIR